MEFAILIIGLVCIFVFSFLMTGMMRRYALTKELIDKPNERSSHIIPTPRGGGLAISLSILCAIQLLFVLKKTPDEYAIALGGGGLLVSLVAWLDDHYDLPARWRALFYLMASLWAVLWIGDFDSVRFGRYEIILSHFGVIMAVLWITWMTNLYNFMDGTDAIASSQAITAGIISGILFWLTDQEGLAVICFVLVSSSAGFLVWNWPPAKIFMGDIGSCFIGYLFGVLSIIGEKSESVSIVIWFVVLSLFICDATLTLIKRILQRERWYSAHKAHAYQRLVQMGMSHKQLAIWLISINIMFLWPVSFLAFKFSHLAVHAGLSVLLLISVLWFVIQVRFKHSHALPL